MNAIFEHDWLSGPLARGTWLAGLGSCLPGPASTPAGPLGWMKQSHPELAPPEIFTTSPRVDREAGGEALDDPRVGKAEAFDRRLVACPDLPDDAEDIVAVVGLPSHEPIQRITSRRSIRNANSGRACIGAQGSGNFQKSPHSKSTSRRLKGSRPEEGYGQVSPNHTSPATP